jgi:hypothetical protein
VAASRVLEEEAWVQFIGGFPLREVIWAALGCGGLSPPPSIVSVVSLPVLTGIFLSQTLFRDHAILHVGQRQRRGGRRRRSGQHDVATRRRWRAVWVH